MTRSTGKLLSLLGLVSFAGVAIAVAQTAAPPPEPVLPEASVPKRPQKTQWVFSILPKAFQKNPFVDLTVITEMTELGKKLPPVSPAAPAYFVAHSSGYRQMGEVIAGEHTLKPDEVERILTRSLATNGYLPATKEHPPTLVIFYTWGSHNLLAEGDPDNPVLSANQVARNLLDRAALVGGVKFSERMLKLFEEADAQAFAANASQPPGSMGPVITPEMQAFMDPIERFKRADPKNDFLVEQFTNDVYYVVASAYDYAALAKKQRQLLWRTRMTVAAQGVSQEQTLPTLIATAAPYFGKDMAEAEIVTKRTVPEGKVEIGTPTVVGVEAAPAEKTPPAKK